MMRIGKKHIKGPAVMGILNITPDSFSDGGLYRTTSDAVSHAMRMIDEGAAIIDIGAESTRPGFVPVPKDEELSRLIPVIHGIREVSDVIISVDTRKADVATVAMAEGADIINDVDSFRDNGMFDCAYESDATIIIMHCPTEVTSVHGTDMVGDPIPQIREFFNEHVQEAIEHGIPKDRIILDPGIGFGKTMEQNIEIVERLDELCIGMPMLMALSRKRMLSVMYPGMPSDEATVKANMLAISKGADIVRVHDVGRMVQAIRE